MRTDRVDIIEHSNEKANAWVNEVTRELGIDDRKDAFRMLRAFLHALRDRLTVDEAAQLAAQLPTLIRGIYYEGWHPSATPQPYRDARTFLERIAQEADLAGETEASYAVQGLAAVLRRRISEGELDDVLHALPPEVRALLAG
ncbi:MAG TPA: DUF2267 domain-containing protein [Methylomirabilota bacterium]|jgi:uncharacterized protein (DUF2267 family)